MPKFATYHTQTGQVLTAVGNPVVPSSLPACHLAIVERLAGSHKANNTVSEHPTKLGANNLL